jgi:hypothetical protein
MDEETTMYDLGRFALANDAVQIAALQAKAASVAQACRPLVVAPPVGSRQQTAIPPRPCVAGQTLRRLPLFELNFGRGSLEWIAVSGFHADGRFLRRCTL